MMAKTILKAKSFRKPGKCVERKCDYSHYQRIFQQTLRPRYVLRDENFLATIDGWRFVGVAFSLLNLLNSVFP